MSMETMEQEHVFLTIIKDGNVLPRFTVSGRLEKELTSCDVTTSQGFSSLCQGLDQH